MKVHSAMRFRLVRLPLPRFVVHPLTAVAVLLSTSTYLVAGRLINWSTMGVAVVALYAYLRRVRRLHARTGSGPGGRPA